MCMTTLDDLVDRLLTHSGKGICSMSIIFSCSSVLINSSMENPALVGLYSSLLMPVHSLHYVPSVCVLMHKTAVYTLVNGIITHQEQQISEKGDITQHGIA